jgi:hypothetical protein
MRPSFRMAAHTTCLGNLPTDTHLVKEKLAVLHYTRQISRTHCSFLYLLVILLVA